MVWGSKLTRAMLVVNAAMGRDAATMVVGGFLC